MDGVSFFLCCLSFDPFVCCGWDERGVVEELCALSGVDRGGLTGVVVVLLKRGWTNHNANTETGTNGVLDWNAGSRSPR